MDLGQGVLMAREHNAAVDPVDEILPPLRMATLGLQHVLVMYAGAVAVPLIVGRALNLAPEDVAFLISADLFCCGIATIIQSLGVTRWFGIQLPVMMGVTFASVGPMVAMATRWCRSARGWPRARAPWCAWKAAAATSCRPAAATTWPRCATSSPSAPTPPRRAAMPS